MMSQSTPAKPRLIAWDCPLSGSLRQLMRSPRSQELDRAVHRPSVLHVIVQLRIVLGQHAVDRRVQKSCMIVARRYDRDARSVGGQGRRRGEGGKADRTGRILLERPHRRTQPSPSKRPCIGDLELSLALLEPRQALLDPVQSGHDLVLEFVVHSGAPQLRLRVIKKISGYGHPSAWLYQAGRGRDGEAMPASRTARMPVRKMPSKVPAPPIEATGAPRPLILSRLRRSAPMSVPIEPPI